jgi:hypothetical protein
LITLRPAAERGHFDHGWLDTWHSFSFADYHDPEHMGFSCLRVINEDRIAPGAGFPAHPHRDMEIITWVLSGALQHRDSLGSGSVIRPGFVQRMSAGTGVVHSEFNASSTAPLHLLQIWILPSERGVAPGYEEKPVPPPDPHSGLALVASPDGARGSVSLHQDARVYLARLAPGGAARHVLVPRRRAWVQVARGSVQLNAESTLEAGAGAALARESAVQLASVSGAEALLFDLP